MKLPGKAQFPITLWPAVPLPPVPVQRSLVVPEGNKLVWRGADEPAVLPDEWVLRQLVDADLEDNDHLIDLMEEFGAIALPYFDSAYVPTERYDLLTLPPSGPFESSEHWWRGRDDGTLEDVRWWLKTARALANMWARASRAEEPYAAWSAEGFVGLDAEKHCWAQFAIALNEGLHHYHARTTYDYPMMKGEPFALGEPRVGLYSAACLQIFNLVVADKSARVCENASCRKNFVNQLGGARYRQNRTVGVKFCSPECARAETQRQYRRRKTARKEDQ
jgi:hypothetical protein